MWNVYLFISIILAELAHVSLWLSLMLIIREVIKSSLVNINSPIKLIIKFIILLCDAVIWKKRKTIFSSHYKCLNRYVTWVPKYPLYMTLICALIPKEKTQLPCTQWRRTRVRIHGSFINRLLTDGGGGVNYTKVRQC